MLTGTLEEFSLADVFRLLSLAKKTGRLTVERQAGRGRVLFRRGDVIYAESSLVRELVGQKLVRAGAATQGQLRKALDRQAATGERLGRILIESGVVDRAALEAAIRSQTEEAVFDLLRWELGEFNWQPTEEVAAEVPIAVSVENLIMEASRRLDELEVIERKVPSLGYVATVTAYPPEGAVEINITPEEWRLLVLVDGRRTLEEIGRAAGFDDFGTLRAVYGLVSAGLVRVLRPEEAASAEAPASRSAEQAEPPVEPFTVEPEELVIAAEPGETSNESPGDTAGPRPLRATPSPAPVAADEIGVGRETREGSGDGLAAKGDEPSPAEDPAPSASDPSSAESSRRPEEETTARPLAEEEAAAPPVRSAPVTPAARVTELEVTSPAPGDREEMSTNGRGAPATNGSPQTRPSTPEGPRLDRSSAARELAGLLDPEPARVEPRKQGQPEDKEEEGDRRKRVEDDDQVTRGLISRFIDGVKGL